MFACSTRQFRAKKTPDSPWKRTFHSPFRSRSEAQITGLPSTCCDRHAAGLPGRTMNACVEVVGRTVETPDTAVLGVPADRVLAVRTDLADPGVGRAPVAAIVEHLGRIDVLGANAGCSESSRIHPFDPAVRERLRRINLDAMIELVDSNVPPPRISWRCQP